MKIRRTVASSVREAMSKVRREQGPDAVILANRKIDEGVEIISATDYDASEFDDFQPMEANRQAPPETAQHSIDADPVTELSYESVALAQQSVAGTTPPAPLPGEVAKVAAPPQEPAPITMAPSAPQLQDMPTPQTREAAKVAAPTQEPGAITTTPVASPPHVTSAPQPGSVAEPQPAMVDISAVQEQPRGADLPRELDPHTWQQGQIIYDLHRELHSLRGLMENQLSVLEWDSLARREPVQFEILSRLTELGIGADIARELVNEDSHGDDMDKSWRTTLARLARRIPIAETDLLDEGGIIALVGPTGVGKTTSVAKLAARCVMRHGQQSVALVSTDCYRIGAHEQLHNYARILGVPFRTARDRDELSSALSGLFEKRLVLIDTAGMSQRDVRLGEQFATLRDSFPIIQSYLVLAANTQLGTMEESVKAFNRVDLAGCVATKLDESTSIGPLVTCAIRQALPLAFVGVGQRVPEDLQPARAHRLISRAVPMAERYSEPPDQDALAARFGSGVAHAGV
ncbi:MAG: flagellar biosynthesis protein FlhF [Pseudomonadota bacterium]